MGMDSREMIDRLRRMEKDSIGDEVANELEKAVAANAVLIETVMADRTEWGVSFNGPNPESKDYVACSSYSDAARLIDLLMQNDRGTLCGF